MPVGRFGLVQVRTLRTFSSSFSVTDVTGEERVSALVLLRLALVFTYLRVESARFLPLPLFERPIRCGTARVNCEFTSIKNDNIADDW